MTGKRYLGSRQTATWIKRLAEGYSLLASCRLLLWLLEAWARVRWPLLQHYFSFIPLSRHIISLLNVGFLQYALVPCIAGNVKRKRSQGGVLQHIEQRLLLVGLISCFHVVRQVYHKYEREQQHGQ